GERVERALLRERLAYGNDQRIERRSRVERRKAPARPNGIRDLDIAASVIRQVRGGQGTEPEHREGNQAHPDERPEPALMMEREHDGRPADSERARLSAMSGA